MSAEIFKFPYDACRRVHSRKPRNSKNGTPEERAAKAAVLQSSLADVVLLPERPAPEKPAIDSRKLRGNPMRDRVAVISFGATVCGKLFTADLKGEPLTDIPLEIRVERLGTLHRAINAMRALGFGLVQATETLDRANNCMSGEEFAAAVAARPPADHAVITSPLLEMQKQSKNSDIPVNLPVSGVGQPVLNSAAEHDQ